MRPSVAAGMILSDFGKVHFVEDATEYTHTGTSDFTTKKTFTDSIEIPDGQVWALEGVFIECELKTSDSGYGHAARILVNSINVDTEKTGTADTYTAKESMDFPPLNVLVLKVGKYDIEFQIQTTNVAKTVSAKNLEVRLAFRRYAV